MCAFFWSIARLDMAFREICAVTLGKACTIYPFSDKYTISLVTILQFDQQQKCGEIELCSTVARKETQS